MKDSYRDPNRAKSYASSADAFSSSAQRSCAVGSATWNGSPCDNSPSSTFISSTGRNTGKLHKVGFRKRETTAPRGETHPPRVPRKQTPPTARSRPVPPLALTQTGARTERGHRMDLRVRVEGVKKLLPPNSASKALPSTFIMVQTATGRGKTPVIFNNANPPFNDEFVFTVRDPKLDEITVVLVSHTPSGNKKLGQCVLSPGNLVCGEEKRRWVSIVRHPGTDQARDYAPMLLSMYTEDFGLRCGPSEAKESEFREKLRALLKNNAPRELHRLEWYVGSCVGDYDGAFSQLCSKYRKSKGTPAAFQLVINAVSDLTDGNGSPSACETCCVKIYAGRVKRVTPMALYRSSAVFNEVFNLSLDDPLSSGITLCVCSPRGKIGECVVSLRGIQKGVAKERTNSLVYAAGTGDASLCGTISFTLYSQTFGVENPIEEAEENARRTRLQNYLWNYLRDDLHRLDPILYSITDVDSFMSVWTRTYGPEPRQHLLRLRIKNLRLLTKLKSPEEFTVVLRTGPNAYRTSCVRYSQDFRFCDELVVSVCTPSAAEFTFIVVKTSDVHEVEMGRATVSFADIPQSSVFKRDIIIYEDALQVGSKDFGTLFIEGITNDFGLPSETLTPERREYYRRRVASILSRYKPTEVYRCDYLLGTHSGMEEQLVRRLSEEYGPETGNAHVNIQILAINDFMLSSPCYVKVYVDDVQVLRTKSHRTALNMQFDISLNNSATLQIENPLRSLLRFELMEPRRFLRSRVVGVAELSLVKMVPNEKNVYRLPVFNAERNGEVGTLSVEIESPSLRHDVSAIFDTPREEDDAELFENVMKDVTTLVSKYCPQNLPHVQPMVAKAASLRDVHRELRDKFTPKRVAFTFYVHIDKLDLSNREDIEAYDEGLISVEAYFMNERVVQPMKVSDVSKARASKLFPEIRFDIVHPHSSEPDCSLPILEIVMHKKNYSTFKPLLAVTRHGTAAAAKPLNVQTTEMGRVVLSARALLTECMYSLGEPVTVGLVSSGERAPQGGTVFGDIESCQRAYIGDLTLRVTVPSFETIPRCLQFSSHVTRDFQQDYVRYHADRIFSLYRAHDPWKLREFYYLLFERDVALGKWPRSLHNWLVNCIKLYGPEAPGTYGPPPKLRLGLKEWDQQRVNRTTASTACTSSGYNTARGSSSAFPSNAFSGSARRSRNGDHGQ
ncbi:putative C2 domain protein [Trypanosoma equiperdum]|uniref:C2 domain-containing protein n=2 Tax=Trypanozoon TaxID=39700 RepID=Q38A05_TRYB2|nr:hypothetical protein, conserved [Trypanosoma brucei brucei TREU927]EAN78365.1 hypothetical protein, conserved [Trypanosoma brucei brucei TREU927]SCU69285.1 predicted C2 domain protein [Trypanosoma equiperdum]